jgi:hypothetical protein
MLGRDGQARDLPRPVWMAFERRQICQYAGPLLLPLPQLFVAARRC